MPFDTTTIRRPTVTVLPPSPPERGDGPRRIVINIEIVDGRKTVSQRYRFGAFTLWLLALLLLAALAHAQPTTWQSYQQGFMTRYQGTDAQGGQWTGSSYKQGFTTYFDATGPHGEHQRCRSWQQGWQTFTECDR